MSDVHEAAVKDHALRFIQTMHKHLAAFAQESYQTDGRGVVKVGIPDLPVGVTSALVATSMVYLTLGEVIRITADVQGDVRDEADVLIRMIETYSPSRQAVLTIAFGGHNPVSVKMKLQPAVLVDEADGVH